MTKILMTVNGLRVNGMSTVILQYIENIGENYVIDIFTDEIDEKLLPRLEKSGVKLFRSSNRKKNQFAYFFELIRILKMGQYDIIHAHGNSATLAVEMLAAKIAGVKVRIAHSHNTTCEHIWFDRFLRLLFYSTYTHGIACGEEAGIWMFGKRKFKVIKNGVDIEKFRYYDNKNKKIREELNISEKFVLGHIGRFTYQKNHEFLLKIFKCYLKKNPNSVLLLVGNGPLEDKIRKIVEENKIEPYVIFYGTTDRPEDLYSVMDVFVFPSRFEGLPLTLVEAQANGLTCLVSDKVSNEVKLTPLVNFLSIDSPEEDWAEFIEKSRLQNKYSRENSSFFDSLNDSGYSLSNTIETLKNFYKEAMQL